MMMRLTGLAGSILWLSMFMLSTFAVSSPLSPRGDNSASGVFSMNLNRNENHQPKGPQAYAHALAKWSVKLPGGIDRVAAAAAGLSGTVPAWNQTFDKEYLSPIMFGNPPQELDMDIDSGSSDCWVFTSQTLVESGIGSLGPRKIWKISDSNTATYVNGSYWQVSYGDGSYATGNVYRDDVHIGPITIPGVFLETAQDASDGITLNDNNISGICGFAYNYPSSVTPNVTSFQQLMLPQLAQPVVTVDLNWKGNGSYTFGAVDTSRNTTDIQYVPLLPDAQFWELNFNGINVGGSNGTNYWLLSQWDCICDTGTSLLLLDPSLAQLYYNQINGSKVDTSWGGWTFPCPASLDNMPDLNIGFPSGYVANIPGRFLMYEQMNADTCYGGVQSSAGLPFSILGDIFMKSQVVVFDFAGAQMGFAPKTL